MTAHREKIKRWLGNIEVSGYVIDWGSGTKPVYKYLKPNNARFTTIDKLKQVNPDILGDIEQPIRLEEQADYAFCLEVIEHVWNTKQLLQNIYINLKPGGTLYMTFPFTYPVHNYDDRIRFTHYGVKQLLEENGLYLREIGAINKTLDNTTGYIVEARRNG